LKESGTISLELIDLFGNLIAEKNLGKLNVGIHQFEFEQLYPTNKLPPAVYLLGIRTDHGVEWIKLLRRD
jgi:hypothetical protein